MFATAGAAAWVAPEILTAKAAGGATLSAPAVVTGPSSTPAALGSNPAGATPSNSLATLAFTGLNIQRDAEVGAVLVAGGWALHHWASRTAGPTPPLEDSGASA